LTFQCDTSAASSGRYRRYHRSRRLKCGTSREALVRGSRPRTAESDRPWNGVSAASPHSAAPLRSDLFRSIGRQIGTAATASVIVGKVVPGGPIGALVFAHGTPLPLAQVRTPPLPPTRAHGARSKPGLFGEAGLKRQVTGLHRLGWPMHLDRARASLLGRSVMPPPNRR
jgi:hypothetical protein